MKKKAKIGIFAGSFNPFHEGHAFASQASIQNLDLDLLLIIPIKQNPDKNVKNESIESRISYIQQYISTKYYKNKIIISDTDLKIESMQMFDLVKYISQHDSWRNSELFVIFGSDCISTMHIWDNYEKIANIAKIFIVERNTYSLDRVLTSDAMQKISHNTILHQCKSPDISSTKIRELTSSNV